MIKLTDILNEIEGQKYTIYCDMDGVIVDFDKGYKDLTGMTTGEANDEGRTTFWKPIAKAGASFWIKLKWMPDGQQLWDYIKPYNPILLSAPSKEESSKIGKRVWVKQNIPGVKLILRPASQKQQFSGENQILIDDRVDNIEQWKSKGGIGILHTSASDTIKQLKELGL
jgi:hypothetical protein